MSIDASEDCVAHSLDALPIQMLFYCWGVPPPQKLLMFGLESPVPRCMPANHEHCLFLQRLSVMHGLACQRVNVEKRGDASSHGGGGFHLTSCSSD